MARPYATMVGVGPKAAALPVRINNPPGSRSPGVQARVEESRAGCKHFVFMSSMAVGKLASPTPPPTHPPAAHTMARKGRKGRVFGVFKAACRAEVWDCRVPPRGRVRDWCSRGWEEGEGGARTSTESTESFKAAAK